jgi:predicted nucleotidyltransferase
MGDRADPTATLDLAALKAYFGSLGDVSFALLFGSHARGQAGPLSDVDVAVMLDGSPDGDRCWKRRLEIMGDLTSLLHTDEVDVAILNEVPVALRYRVFRDGVVLSCRDRRRMVEFQARTLSEYFDFLPILERHNRAIIEGARTGKLFHGYNRHRGSLERYRRIRERLKGAAGPDVR